MTKIIRLIVKNKNLEIKEGFTPIVCGTSGNILKFDFDDIWKKIKQKTAVFVVGADRLYIDFEGDEVRVPVLPNCTAVDVRLVCTPSVATNFIKLRTEPSMYAK